MGRRPRPQVRVQAAVRRHRGQQGLGRLAAAADPTRLRPAVHVKVDTGMGRLGVSMRELPAVCEALKASSHLKLEGFSTHLASSEILDAPSAEEQLQQFQEAERTVRQAGLKPSFIHAANTSAVISRRESWHSMVRPGLALYRDAVRVSTVAIQQGNLTITVRESPAVSQPNPFTRGGQTVVVPQSDLSVNEETGKQFLTVKSGASLSTLVAGLNYVISVHEGGVDFVEQLRAREKGDTGIGAWSDADFIAACAHKLGGPPGIGAAMAISSPSRATSISERPVPAMARATSARASVPQPRPRIAPVRSAQGSSLLSGRPRPQKLFTNLICPTHFSLSLRFG